MISGWHGARLKLAGKFDYAGYVIGGCKLKIAWAIGALALLATGLSASAGRADLNGFIERELLGSAAPGLAYARVADGEIDARGFGTRIEGRSEPITEDTLFPIGSVTKSFTAVGIIQLVEEGKLGLDEPVGSYLPAFSKGAANGVTLRHLLNHTSGFSTVQGNRRHGDADGSKIGLTEYAERLASLEPAHAAGQVWEYSNANYQILGAVIEQTSGQNYARFIETRIFDPLGMGDSEVGIGTAQDDIAIGHRPWFGSVRAFSNVDDPINAPAGGIVSSGRDMGRYLAMWLNDRDGIISAKSKAMMLSPSSSASPRYGLGWNVDPEAGSVYHTGLVPGSETLVSFLPAEKKGVAVMVNANSGLGFADTWYLIGGVGALALDQPYERGGGNWGPKFAYLSIALLPPLFVLLVIISWRGRSMARANWQSTSGQLGLWIPLVAMLGLSWFLLAWLPSLFGGSFATIRLFQPDFALCIIATAVLAPLWALVRLALAYGIPKS